MAALASWAIEEPAISHSASFEIDEEAEVAVESDDLRNRIDASAVNQYDLMMISGNYGYRPQFPPLWAQKESAARSQWATLRTTPSSRLSAKRVSRSWYAASAKFARNCNRHVNRKE